ncbi:hypothetical protein LTR16_012407, partial [Cryomyces antarcticus]
AQRRPRVLDAVVPVLLLGLNVLFQQVPGEEAQREAALARADEEEVHGVDDLGARDVDVNGAEVLWEAVSDEDAAQVQQQPELLVGNFK